MAFVEAILKGEVFFRLTALTGIGQQAAPLFL